MKLRNADFAKDFEKAVIDPAIAVGKSQRVRGLHAPVEILKRTVCLITWLVCWIVLRTFNRTVYMFSKNPKMEILGKLGSADESPDGKQVQKEDKFMGDRSNGTIVACCLWGLAGLVWHRSCTSMSE